MKGVLNILVFDIQLKDNGPHIKQFDSEIFKEFDKEFEKKAIGSFLNKFDKYFESIN